MKCAGWLFTFLLTFFINFSTSQVPFTCSGDFYLSQSIGIIDGVSNLFTVKVDSTTQEIIFDALPATNNHLINAIGYRVTDNLIYGLDPSNKRFYKLDATGKSFFLRTLDELGEEDEYFGADIFPSGDFMVMIGGGTYDKNLVIINLSNPNYPTEIIPLKLASTGASPNTRIVDIAFDPLSRDLYGIDILNFRLVKISIGSGIIQDNLFSASNTEANIAAMFFDAFGNLYGYGSSGGPGNFGMYRIDKRTGQLSFVTVGPSAGGVDGCSCPFNISMEKIVYPDTAFVCSEVQYVFRIANGSQSIQRDIDLEDIFPTHFNIVSIDYNPFEIDSISGIGTHKLKIHGIEIPSGLDSIVVRIDVGSAPPGDYGNLASLLNLPEELGLKRFSENPSTLSIGNKDSTYLTLESPMITFEDVDGICEGDTAILSLNVPNATYLWQDGSTDSFFIVTHPGIYSVTATNGCDIFEESIEIEQQSIDVRFDPEEITLILGNDFELAPIIVNSGMVTEYLWNDPLVTSLDCHQCINPTATPLSNIEYLLTVRNEYGCIDSAKININVEINRALYIPNIFSPNNDFLNDRFYIQGAGNFNIIFFHIYDRWGNLVYKESDTKVNESTSGWDGTFNGKILDPGVFTWHLKVKYIDSIESELSGTITLVK